MILRVDVGRREGQFLPCSEGWQRLGGRGLVAQILLDEVPPTCDALGPHNRLIFAPGLLVGHMLSSCDRISVGGKSPLTGGVKESNAGGTTGFVLAALGLRAIIIQGWPQDAAWQVLHISRAGVRFDPAGECAGLGAYASADWLRQRYGSRAAMALIGPAGEMGLLTAGILNLDKDGVPSRISARGGLGALMGSKRLKAIVFDGEGGSRPPLHDAAAYRLAQKVFLQALLGQPQTRVYRELGTAGVATLSNQLGALPVCGFAQGQFAQIEQIAGEHLRDVLLARGGDADPSHACMAGCVIRSSNVFAGADGQALVSPLEYETIGLMGSNLGIADLDAIAHLNWAANDLGLDTIDLGAAFGVAAQAGLMSYGDSKRALELLQEVRLGSPLGRLLGCGAALTGRVLGVRRVPAVKGQALSAYDPRAVKGTGVTYATSPQGADHTAGLTIRARVDHLDPHGQAALSRTAQINMAGYDTLGACIFAGFGFAAAPDALRDLLNARYAWAVGSDILQVLGRQTLRLERAFNRAAGFGAADDRLPEWMTQEALPPTGAVFDVSAADLDGVFDEIEG